jgi:ribosomally synthesized peptide (two-chain TOMM family)
MATTHQDDDGFTHTVPYGVPLPGDRTHPVGPEDPLVGLRGALAWQYAWTTAIALAWADPDKARELMTHPRRFFKVYAGYDLPEGLNLTVKQMKESDTKHQKTGWDPANRMWYLQNTELTMFIPPAPPVDQQAVALAAYVATARAYPFTGC